ncbi:MAG TPA: redoxin domain-containing protein, partial [Gemmatales bacterium]|nr:redoxin domain-containing protein [Gemmatales bacterium]
MLKHTVKNIEGKEVNLADYQGKVVLVVNVASACGYTKQYTNLQAVYEKYKDKGLVVLGFPCNQFGGQ